MADGGNDLPAGNYPLELGTTFRDAGKSRQEETSASYHTIRYDFKPGSTTVESDQYIAFGSNSDVHVAVPSETGDNLSVFKGSKKEVRPKECLLFFDKNTGKMRLEQLNSAIMVKKARDLDSATENALKNGIEQVRLREGGKRRKPAKNPDEPATSHEDDMEISSSSSSSSSSDSDSDSDSSKGDKRERRDSDSSKSSNSDDESHLLEKMKTIPSPSSVSSAGEHSQAVTSPNAAGSQPATAPNPPAPAPATMKIRKTHDSLGLNLSESSDEDE
ncbi:hypothetical protein WR25_18885 [Diploscapter pachys]|uniref:Ell-associated factor Eaf n=1 Tax=Diploscapter pachys TaxID=2018661 RepID=A0A2A2KH98_9BILA|nr:hypothetical protein WR25_18885 [Diploscapter pachys]